MEVVVELHHVAVAQLERVEVVVLDVVRDEAPCERVDRLVARRREPLAVARAARLPCRWQAAGTGSTPTRGCSRSTRAIPQARGRAPCPPRGSSRAPRRSVSYGPHSSRPGAPAIPWRSVRTCCPATFIVLIRKNLTSSSGPPFTFSRTGHAFGPWIWKRQSLRVTCLPMGRIGERSSFSTSTSYPPVSAWNSSQFAAGARPTNTNSSSSRWNRIPSPITLPGRRGRDVLLGHVDGEGLDAVDRRVGDQLHGVGPRDEEVDHVMRLVVEDRRLAPGPLLAAPVRELGGDDRVHVGADL